MANQSYLLITGKYGIYDPAQVRLCITLAQHPTVEWPQITSRSTTSADVPGSGTRSASNVVGSTYGLYGVTDGRLLLRMLRGCSGINAYRLHVDGIVNASEAVFGWDVVSKPSVSWDAGEVGPVSFSVQETPAVRYSTTDIEGWSVVAMPAVRWRETGNNLLTVLAIPAVSWVANTAGSAVAGFETVETPSVRWLSGPGATQLECITASGSVPWSTEENYVF
jgi:hypothetical protein